jgi:hypothetical protein
MGLGRSPNFKNDSATPFGRFEYQESSPAKNDRSPVNIENPFTRTDNNAFSKMANIAESNSRLKPPQQSEIFFGTFTTNLDEDQNDEQDSN